VAFGLGAEVSWGDAYFTDANGDGLPDYVSGGTVWFNHLDGNGVPTFVEGDSSATDVPIVDGSANVVPPPAVQDIQDQLRQRTCWSTPCAGDRAVQRHDLDDAPVTLNPLNGDSHDGVRRRHPARRHEIVAGNLADHRLAGIHLADHRGRLRRRRHLLPRRSVNDGANDRVD
jgi:hypothetical protein